MARGSEFRHPDIIGANHSGLTLVSGTALPELPPAGAALLGSSYQAAPIEAPAQLVPVSAFERREHNAARTLASELLHPSRRMAKRAIDLALAAAALLLLLPMLLITALLIRLDSRGPIIFCQTRIGLGNRPFQVYKFRTMTCCEDDQDEISQARRNDPRVTRVGRLLRHCSVDELPQLFNVLAGTMSLVGPRPHAVAHDRKYAGLIPRYAQRHAIKPGITGWAQVNGYRGETQDIEAMRGRVVFDLSYIENWSIFLDFAILVMTVREVLRSRNAY